MNLTLSLSSSLSKLIPPSQLKSYTLLTREDSSSGSCLVLGLFMGRVCSVYTTLFVTVLWSSDVILSDQRNQAQVKFFASFTPLISGGAGIWTEQGPSDFIQFPCFLQLNELGDWVIFINASNVWQWSRECASWSFKFLYMGWEVYFLKIRILSSVS